MRLEPSQVSLFIIVCGLASARKPVPRSSNVTVIAWLIIKNVGNRQNTIIQVIVIVILVIVIRGWSNSLCHVPLSALWP